MDTLLHYYNTLFAQVSSELAFYIGVGAARFKLVLKVVKGPFKFIFLFMRLVTLYGHLRRLHRRKLLLLYTWRIIKGMLLLFTLLVIVIILLLVFAGCSTKYADVRKPLNINTYLDKNISHEGNASSLKQVKRESIDLAISSFNLNVLRRNLNLINPSYTSSSASSKNVAIAKATKRNILKLAREKGLPAALAYHNDSLLQKFDLVDESKHDVTLSKFDKDIAATQLDSSCQMSGSKQCAAVNVLLKSKLHLIRNMKLYLARHNISSPVRFGDHDKADIIIDWLSKNKLYIVVYGRYLSESDDYIILDNSRLFRVFSSKFKRGSFINEISIENISISKIEFLYSKSKLTRLAKRKKAVILSAKELNIKFTDLLKETVNQLLQLNRLRKSCNVFTKACFKQNLLLKVLPTNNFNIFKNTIKGTINE